MSFDTEAPAVLLVAAVVCLRLMVFNDLLIDIGIRITFVPTAPVPFAAMSDYALRRLIAASDSLERCCRKK